MFLLKFFTRFQCLQKGVRDFLKFFLDLKLLIKMQKSWFLFVKTRPFLIFASNSKSNQHERIWNNQL